jgi:hypothetical protein
LTLHAFILASAREDSTRDLLRPIAGAPLLVRQLEWLSAAGVTHVTVNRVASEPLPPAMGVIELSQTGVHVTWIPSARPLELPELAARVGPVNAPALVLPHACLGDLDLRAAVTLARDCREDVAVVCDDQAVSVRHLDKGPRPQRTIDGEGWLLQVLGEATAQNLVEQVLLGVRKGIVIRGTEVSPGIWRARGALAVEAAVLQPPCYLGENAFISERAVVGPGAVVGECAIIESAARVVHARVAPHVVVGQGVVVQHACAMPGRIVRHAGRDVDIDDPLLLGVQGASGNHLARLLAALALGALAPAAVVLGGRPAQLAHRVARIMEGTASWIGVRDGFDPDAVALDVLRLLVPPDAHEEERTAARALYARNKSLGLDAKLLAGWLLGANRSAT